jgi:ABC-type amino acid transport system permease subunit
MIRGAESKVIRGWAVLDLTVSALFALPPLAALLLDVLYSLNGRLGGVSVAPPFEPVHWLFVCLMGGLGVVWAVARIVEPMRKLGLIDAAARLWVAVLIAYFVFVRGAPVVLLLFVATEFGGALHQSWLLRRPARDARW